ncbi:hypothetical protein ACGFJC_47525 [Nonomuraea fuscirosea]|uniref:hypothetical protein n=1 Tax=Nonomuraea fuscirosea TaxID=1291556 RepID=UPI00371D1263
MPDQTPPAADLFAQLTNALSELLAHARGDASCGNGCIWMRSPGHQAFDCPGYENAVGLVELARERDLIVLDQVAAPVPGETPVKVHRDGELYIPSDEKRVYYNSPSGPGMWREEKLTGQEAISFGLALIAAGMKAESLPNPAEVKQLAAAMAGFDGTATELARHLIASGWKRDGDQPAT